MPRSRRQIEQITGPQQLLHQIFFARNLEIRPGICQTEVADIVLIGGMNAMRRGKHAGFFRIAPKLSPFDLHDDDGFAVEMQIEALPRRRQVGIEVDLSGVLQILSECGGKGSELRIVVADKSEANRHSGSKQILELPMINREFMK